MFFSLPVSVNSDSKEQFDKEIVIFFSQLSVSPEIHKIATILFYIWEADIKKSLRTYYKYLPGTHVGLRTKTITDAAWWIMNLIITA